MRVAACVWIAAVATAGADAAREDDTTRALAKSFAADPAAKASALALYERTGSIAEAGSDEIMDGGFRGKIHLVPQLPIGKYRAHIAWVADAMIAIDAFFTAQLGEEHARYRWRDLRFRFVRSVGKRTPSAYATSWTIVYNVEGSLLTSATGVRETLFHELFHDNDEAHGNWSAKTLAHDYAAIVKKCGTRTKCLAPYAPNDTKMRGGTFYAFTQNNGDTVHEYAAELAVRYFKEQSEMLAHKKLAHAAFKCGPPENARAWRALVDEFFAGIDRVPACRG
jgi:hypothetical protein